MSQERWVDALLRAERLPDDYRQSVADVIAPLAAWIAELFAAKGRPLIVGICGAQGSGKSTLALFLQRWLRDECGIDAATLSLDDLYLTKAERTRLAKSRHPLLATRGVPGTHDVTLGTRLLEALTAGTGKVRLPRFDKASDDRVPAADWEPVDAPVDVVLFEGWFVGARAEEDSALEDPLNALEALEDADGSWRRYVNERLATDYAQLFAGLDVLVLLRVPSFDQVFEWRALQERKLSGAVDSDSLERFIRHFERLTRHILADMPRYADKVIPVDGEHRMAALDCQRRPDSG